MSPGNIDYLRSLGADEVIDYRATRFEDAGNGYLTSIAELIDKEELKVIISGEFPLADAAAAALASKREGHTRGKLLITVNDPL